jgi:RNA polymerase sigma factor (sigma-70 family)
MADDPISRWIELARTGDRAAQQGLWDRFFPELVRLARFRLQGQPQRLGDEEDVVLSVFESFFRASADQKKGFPALRGRDDLWRLLSRMTHRKVIDWLRHAQRQKRHVLGESALVAPPDGRWPGLDAQPHAGPTPPLELIVAEEIRGRLDQLGPEMRRVAVAKLEGYTNQEIAGRHGCSVATVERRLKMIREIWNQPASHTDESRSAFTAVSTPAPSANTGTGDGKATRDAPRGESAEPERPGAD